MMQSVGLSVEKKDSVVSLLDERAWQLFLGLIVSLLMIHDGF